jgi:branched-subunit amino acid transport protein AzlD
MPFVIEQQSVRKEETPVKDLDDSTAYAILFVLVVVIFHRVIFSLISLGIKSFILLLFVYTSFKFLS